VLEDHAHRSASLTQRAAVQASEVLPVDADRAGGRLDQADRAAEECGLAAAVLPEHDHQLAWLDGQVDGFQRATAADVLLGEIFNL
jgi:hypothetical protein